MKKKIYILDLDDGPDGGGGATLAKVLVNHGIRHESWVPTTMSSGWLQSESVSCTSEEELSTKLCQQQGDVQYIPGTHSVLGTLSRMIEDCGDKLDSGLRQLLGSPRGIESLLRAEREDLPVANHVIVDRRLEENECQAMLAGGWMLDDEGLIHAIEDAGEAWYRNNQAHRSGAKRVALIPANRRLLVLGTHYVVDQDIRHSSFLRVDSIRPSWRPALGRTVAGRLWQRAEVDFMTLEPAPGFWQSAWLIAPGESTAQFVASMPLPSPWIQIDPSAWVEAMQNPRESKMSPADHFYADAPIDMAIDGKTLLARGVQ